MDDRLDQRVQQEVENHEAALALFFALHNFCRVHSTLNTTPAVDAGLTDHTSTIELLRCAKCDLDARFSPLYLILRRSP